MLLQTIGWSRLVVSWLAKKHVFGSPVRTQAPLWWTSNIFLLAFLQCAILHSCIFGQNSPKTTQFCAKLGFGFLQNVARLDKKSVFDPSPKTHTPLWWTNNEYSLAFLSCVILHSCVFGWNRKKTSQFCYKIGVGLVDCGDAGHEICLVFPSQDSSTFLMNQCSVFIGILIVNNPAWLLFCIVTWDLVTTGD